MDAPSSFSNLSETHEPIFYKFAEIKNGDQQEAVDEMRNISMPQEANPKFKSFVRAAVQGRSTAHVTAPTVGGRFISLGEPTKPRFRETRPQSSPSPSPPRDLTRAKPPWWIYIDEKRHSGLDGFGKLHQEIVALTKYFEPSKQEITKRQRVWAKLLVATELTYGPTEILPFGSYLTGLSLPDGDVDFCIKQSGNEPPQQYLRCLAAYIQRLGIPAAMELILSARVPIIKYVDRESNISVDISLHQESCDHTTTFITEQLHKYETVRPLILLLKTYLSQRGLGDTYTGGMGSYLAFTLLVAGHQSYYNTLTPEQARNSNLGHIFLHFLSFISYTLEYDTCVDVIGKQIISKGSVNMYYPGRDRLLAVISPMDRYNDLGRNSYRIEQIRKAMRVSLQLAFQAVQENRDGVSILERIISSTHPMFHRKAPPDMPVVGGLRDIPRSPSDDLLLEVREECLALLAAPPPEVDSRKRSGRHPEGSNKRFREKRGWGESDSDGREDGRGRRRRG